MSSLYAAKKRFHVTLIVLAGLRTIRPAIVLLLAVLVALVVGVGGLMGHSVGVLGAFALLGIVVALLLLMVRHCRLLLWLVCPFGQFRYIPSLRPSSSRFPRRKEWFEKPTGCAPDLEGGANGRVCDPLRHQQSGFLRVR